MGKDDAPVGYQLRHARYGLFQGELMGMGFWYDPSSPYAMPEQGILEFRTYDAVSSFRAFLCSSDCDQTLLMSELTIEPYNREYSEQLRASAGNY